MPKQKNPPSHKASARRGKKITIKKKKLAKGRKVLVYPHTKRGAGANKKGNKKISRYGVGVKKKIHPVKYRSPAKILRSKTWAGKKTVISPRSGVSASRRTLATRKAKLFNRVNKNKKSVKQKKILAAKTKKPAIKTKSSKKVISKIKGKKSIVKKVIKKNKTKKNIKKIIKPKKKIAVKPRKSGSKAKLARGRGKIVIKKISKKSPKKKVIKPKKNIVKKIKVAKIHQVKSTKGGVSRKAKKFNRVKKITKPKIRPIKSHKVAVLAKPKLKKVSISPQTAQFSAEMLFKAKIKVIGIGGGGGSIVSEIGRSLQKATFVIADTDIRALKKKSGIKYFWFGEDLTHGLGTGVNVDLAKQAAEGAKEKISSVFQDQDIIIFIASLGGGLGSGATQVFAEAAREFGGITFGIFTMPFKFEGKNKQRIAQNALKSLRQSLNVSLVIPNEKIFKIIDTSTPIINAFSIVNKSLIESLESLIDLIYNPGIINIDFADLRTILKGRGNSAFLNTIEESGKDKVEKICEKILRNPLLQNNSFKAEKILFNIAGGENLSMFEVEKISSHIANLNPKAKIIFGISKDNKLKNKIKTTILMTGGQTKEDEPIKEIKSVKPIIIEKIKNPIKKAVKKEKKSKIKFRKPKNKKQNISIKKPSKKPASAGGSGVAKEEKLVSFVPVFEVPVPTAPAIEQRRMEIIEISPESKKKTIRRSGLEIRKAEELQDKKRMAQEKEWEIPTFLRRRPNN